MRLFNRLRQFDAYYKTLEDFRVRTFGGAVVTIISSLVMLTLFISELRLYMSKEVYQELFVDTMRWHKIEIDMDITFPQWKCDYITIDAMDVSGEQQIDVAHSIYRRRLDLDGNVIEERKEQMLGNPDASKGHGHGHGHGQAGEHGEHAHEAGTDEHNENPKPPAETAVDQPKCYSCYGAETPSQSCCNTCEELRAAYRAKGWALLSTDNYEQCQNEVVPDVSSEGCQIVGKLSVNKVAGNIHFAPGKTYLQSHAHVHDIEQFRGQRFNVSHNITKLAFGAEYPGQANPLDGSGRYMTADDQNQYAFTYFIKMVPTTYERADGSVVYTNQYSVTRYSKPTSGTQSLPGVFFVYELSAMMVKYTEQHKSFIHFLTGVCAIVGGVFTVASLIDALIYKWQRVLQKMQLGKAH